MGGFSLKAELDGLDGPARESAEARLGTLREALAALGDYVLRDDSRLAFSFATGSGDAATMTPAEVAADMALTQHLYANTCYRSLWDRDLKQVTGWIRHHYPRVPWKVAWAIVRDTMDPCCKLEAYGRAEA